MRTIAVVSQKGGAGKTTLSVHLAVAAARAGYSVAVIDLDQQATAAQWADWRNDDTVAVVAAPHGRLLPTLEEARRSEVDLVIIDSPPASGMSLYHLVQIWGLYGLDIVLYCFSTFIHVLFILISTYSWWMC